MDVYFIIYTFLCLVFFIFCSIDITKKLKKLEDETWGRIKRLELEVFK